MKHRKPRWGSYERRERKRVRREEQSRALFQNSGSQKHGRVKVIR